MNLGKISDIVYKRTIGKQMRLPETGMVFEEKTVFGSDKKIGIFAVASVINRLRAQQVEILGICVKILLPDFAYESRLKSMADYIISTCKLHCIDIQKIDAEVSPVITSSIVQVVGIGKKEQQIKPSINKELDIVLTKYIGMEGTIRLLHERNEMLKTRFLPSFLQSIERKEENFFCNQEIEIAMKKNTTYMCTLGEGGIYAALWNMADELGVGIAVNGEEISIRQETIEICEYFNLNPYQIASEGNLLILTENGEDLQAQLKENQIQAAVIGTTTMENQKTIRRGEDIRFLDKPAPDELLKIFESEKNHVE